MSKKKSISTISTTPFERKDEWRTNPLLFKLLNKEFRFKTDVASTKENKLCERHFTKENSALLPENRWIYKNKFFSAFCNPPFSLFSEFLKRGNDEMAKTIDGVIVFVIRGDSPETKWFRDNLIGSDGYPLHEIRHYYPRIRFVDPDGIEQKNIGFPTAVVVMRPQRVAKVVWKAWREQDLQIPFDRAPHYASTRFGGSRRASGVYNHPPFP